MAIRKFVCCDSDLNLVYPIVGDHIDLQGARVINVPTPTEEGHIASRGYCLGLNPSSLGSPVQAQYRLSANQALTANVTPINYDTVIQDTDGAVTIGSGWKFTCPVGKGGWYRIYVNTVTTDTTNLWFYLYKSGVSQFPTVFVPTSMFLFATMVNVLLSDGEYVDMRAGANVTMYGSDIYTSIHIVSWDRY